MLARRHLGARWTEQWIPCGRSRVATRSERRGGIGGCSGTAEDPREVDRGYETATVVRGDGHRLHPNILGSDRDPLVRLEAVSVQLQMILEVVGIQRHGGEVGLARFRRPTGRRRLSPGRRADLRWWRVRLRHAGLRPRRGDNTHNRNEQDEE